ncbi:histidine phosphotransferase family protein [Pukyongiella litopenaei]|uniref:Histidine phosphotransferase n=1 Tax=Pukyongiella litopenaei TaxID=2605946 RepID=A0A2S0MUK8_9RHOB|nr:histidine phosphotransferase family protein [Pukyongiella litopenaei]AVO39487.1 histidine phosphotransferase [Pukyongiella litopenaei]
MSDTNVNLAALIGSRICHDLISPIGAITNGLELLDLTGATQGPEMELIADSVGNAGARIRFFRIAYGRADDQMISRAEIVSVLDDMGRGGRLRVDWSPADPLPRSEVRLAFLALQCFETAMPYGGTVCVDSRAGRWRMVGEAGKMTMDAALWAIFDGAPPPDPVTPAQVQFALIPQVARDLGRRMSYSRDSDHRLVLEF